MRGCADRRQPWPERPAAKQQERETLTTVAAMTARVRASSERREGGEVGAGVMVGA